MFVYPRDLRINLTNYRIIGASSPSVKDRMTFPRSSGYRKEESMDNDTIVGHRTRVYVAGPYTKGDVAVNVREAVRVSDELLRLGYAPYCPHLTHFWHMLFPSEYQTWLDLDNEWVTCCDTLLRIPGESSGADKEVALAESLGLPVFFSVKEFADAVPTVRPEGGIRDPEAQQLEACWPAAGQTDRDASIGLPRGIPEGVSVVASQTGAGALQYNSELPKGIPDEVTVEASGGDKPEPDSPSRSLAYKEPK